MSADGRIICAVPSTAHPNISTNFGNTWAVATNSPPWGSIYLGNVAFSADGSVMFAPFSTNTTQKTWIFASQDVGASWNRTAFPSTTTSTNYRVACSADGIKVIAALGHGGIFYSTNGGANCYTSSVAPAYWTSLASSADGGRMVAAANGGSIYFSQDFGATWTATNLPAESWSSVCTSVDGKWVGATSGNHTCVSSNFGATWLTNNFAGRSIACSANGFNWVVTSTQIETSVDGGNSWQTNLPSSQWNGAAISADGCLMIVQGSSQATWVGRLTPSPQMNVQLQDTNVTVSWLIPSTNFVLQQTADLSTPVWTQVGISPTLNFTNLKEEATVPANGSNTFLRLMAQ